MKNVQLFPTVFLVLNVLSFEYVASFPPQHNFPYFPRKEASEFRQRIDDKAQNPQNAQNTQNDGKAFKITYPEGEIIVPSDKKNVHIKTIDVFEEKSPDFFNNYNYNDAKNKAPKGSNPRGNFDRVEVDYFYNKNNGNNEQKDEEIQMLSTEENQLVADNNGGKTPDALNLGLILLENGAKLVRDLINAQYSKISYKVFKLIEVLLKYFFGSKNNTDFNKEKM